MKKFSKWRLFKWDMQRTWESSFVGKNSIIGWAYLKLWWALIFTNNEFSPLLNLNGSAMMAMTKQQRKKYMRYVSKTRDRIGGHSYHQNLNQTLGQTKNPQMNSENFSKNL